MRNNIQDLYWYFGDLMSFVIASPLLDSIIIGMMAALMEKAMRIGVIIAFIIGGAGMAIPEMSKLTGTFNNIIDKV